MYAAFHILIIITEFIQIMYKLQELLDSCRKKKRERKRKITRRWRRRVKRRGPRNAAKPAHGNDRPARKIERKVASRPPERTLIFGIISDRWNWKRAVALQLSRVRNGAETSVFHSKPFLSLRLGTVAPDRGMLLGELDRERSGRRHERERLVAYAFFFM